MVPLSKLPVDLEATIREVIAHFRPDVHPNSILAPLRAALSDEDFRGPRFALLLWYAGLMHRLDWKELPTELVLGPLTALPKLASSIDEPVSYTQFWPLSLAAMAMSRNIQSQVEKPTRTSTKSMAVDLFLPVTAANLVHRGFTATSAIRDSSGIEQRGIAVECKACSSRKNLSKSVGKGLDQLARCRGGVLAVDVSEIVRQELKKAFPRDFLVCGASIFNQVQRDVVNAANRSRRLPFAALIVGVQLWGPRMLAEDSALGFKSVTVTRNGKVVANEEMPFVTGHEFLNRVQVVTNIDFFRRSTARVAAFEQFIEYWLHDVGDGFIHVP